MSNDGDIVTRGTAERTTVASLLFNVGHDGTFGDSTEREDIADSEVGVLAGVDELTSVHALVGDEHLSPILELVGASELHFREGSATAGVVDDLLDYATDVAMSLGEVELSELRRSLVQASVGGCSMLAQFAVDELARDHTEDRAAALPLIPNNSTHGAIESNKNRV